MSQLRTDTHPVPPNEATPLMENISATVRSEGQLALGCASLAFTFYICLSLYIPVERGGWEHNAASVLLASSAFALGLRSVIWAIITLVKPQV